MAKREKKVIVSNVTEAQLNDAMTNYAKADAKLQSIQADLDLRIAKLREARTDELLRLQEEKDNNFEVCNAYAIENKDSIFLKKKSLDLSHGTIGFRTGTPKLKTKRGFTWPAVTQLLKEFLPSYVRTVEEPAKDKLLADREDDNVADNLLKVGVEVVQDETFYIELKKEAKEE